MAQPPRGRPPSKAPPPSPAGRGRNALTYLGGGVLLVAVAGVAWATFGRDRKTDVTAASSVPTATSPSQVLGPQVPGAPPKASTATTPTTVTPATRAPVKVGPVASAAPTVAATKAPTKAPAVRPASTKPPVVTPPAVTAPTVTQPQQGGTVAQKDYTFRIARGDTMWDLTRQALSATGRSTSNATVAAFLPRFAAKNASAIGSNPDRIVPGQIVVWPTGL